MDLGVNTPLNPYTPHPRKKHPRNRPEPGHAGAEDVEGCPRSRVSGG